MELTNPENGTGSAVEGLGIGAKADKRMSARVNSIGWTTLAICGSTLAATLFVGCSQGSSPGAPGAGSPPSGPQRPSNGTGDSAGGNGTRGLIYEDYIRDVRTLPEWQQIVAPLDAKLRSFDENADETEYHSIFNSVAINKRWYFIPGGLAAIPRERLGVEFIQDPEEQHALQNDREVWVDDDLHRVKPLRAKARLLVHEVVVALYLVKFQTIDEACRLSARQPQVCIRNFRNIVASLPDDEARASFRRMMDPDEPKRPLNRADYQAIRAMTDWMMNQLPTATEEQLRAEYARLGFSRRLYYEMSPEMEWRPRQTRSDRGANSDQPEQVVVSFAALLEGLTAQNLTATAPTRCAVEGANLSPAGTCQLSLALTQTPGLFNMLNPGLRMSLRMPGEAAPRVFQFGGESSQTDLNLSAPSDGSNRTGYLHVSVSGTHALQVGEILPHAIIKIEEVRIGRMNNEPTRVRYRIRAVAISFGVVTSVTAAPDDSTGAYKPMLATVDPAPQQAHPHLFISESDADRRSLVFMKRYLRDHHPQSQRVFLVPRN